MIVINKALAMQGEPSGGLGRPLDHRHANEAPGLIMQEMSGNVSQAVADSSKAANMHAHTHTHAKTRTHIHVHTHTHILVHTLPPLFFSPQIGRAHV